MALESAMFLTAARRREAGGSAMETRTDPRVAAPRAVDQDADAGLSRDSRLRTDLLRASAVLACQKYDYAVTTLAASGRRCPPATRKLRRQRRGHHLGDGKPDCCTR
jgi:hypothetical protein